MRKYRVHLYTKPAIVDGHPHWIVSSGDFDLIEVGDRDEGIAFACALAGTDARLSGADVEVLVDAFKADPERRITFPGTETPVETVDEVHKPHVA